ncbi:hypothetical protein JCM14469_12730 [Desulfatiferula olefinivorans]
MKHHSLYEVGAFFTTALDMVHVGLVMNRERLSIIERMEEILSMCHRDHPIYDRISSFTVALYTLGCPAGLTACPDLMAFDDVDGFEVARILKDSFTLVSEDAVPDDYHITQSNGTYLLVVGDPCYPVHVAVLANQKSDRPFFSKLPFLGAGFDSLEDLRKEFVGIDGVSPDDFHYFRKNEGAA